MFTNTRRVSALRNCFRCLVLLGTYISICSFSVAARRERRIEAWKPVHYNVALTLSRDLNEIRKATTEVTINTLDSFSTIDLDFGEMVIDSVKVNKVPVRFTHSAGMLVVKLQKPAIKGDRLVVAVGYHGKPKDGLILTNDKDGRPAAVGDNWPNRLHHWVPSFDHPAAKASVTFSITAPQENVVVANGKLLRVSAASGMMRTWSYSEAAPIPPYCIVFAAGQFSQIQPTESAITSVSYYVPHSDVQPASRGFSIAIPALKLFNDLVAPYPYDKLALIIGATRFGGMENSSAIVFSSSLFDPSPNATLSPRFGVRSGIVELVAHEIAHQWFGDSVTEKTWADLWLSEGFATYFAGVFLQSRESEGAFRKYMQVAADSIIRFEREKLVPLHDLETEDLVEMLNTSNYQKGAWVLHMLRSQMGDAAFFDGLRRYYEAHKHSVATSEDLRRALEQASGMDLIPFFESWVYGTGHPRYELSWEWQADPGLLRVHLKQRQDQESFPNWVPLEVTTPSRKSRLVLKPTAKRFVAEYPLNEAPTNLEFDPDSTILKEVTIKPLSRTVSN